MRKRILSVILLICMLVNNLPVAAFAEGTDSGCSHVCDSSCGYVAAVDCDKGCTPAEEGGEIVHGDDCAYNAGSPCSHKHNGKCGVACTHTYSQGICSVCGAVCEHSYTEGVCTGCGMAKPEPVCDCESKCTAEDKNNDCVLCAESVENCAIEPTPVSWSWVDNEDGVSPYQEDDGTWTAEMSWMDDMDQASAFLPAFIQIGETQVAITWTYEQVPEEESVYLFTATPQDYDLPEGTSAPKLKVNLISVNMLGEQDGSEGSHEHCLSIADHPDGCTCESKIKFEPFDLDITNQSRTIENRNLYLTEDITNTGNYSNSPALTISGTVNLCLNGFTISAPGRYQVILVSPGATLNLCDCSQNQTGAVTANSTSNGSSYYTQGIVTTNSANACFNLYSGRLSHGYYGVSNSNGTFNMYGGVISNNFVAGVTNRVSGKFTMEGGTICNNKSSQYGAGVNNTADFTMSGGEIKNNINTGTGPSYGKGGGIYTGSGTLRINGGKITGNTAAQGGGIAVNGATAFLHDAVITGNYATEAGGGLAITSNPTYKYMPTVSGNTKITGNTIATITDGTITDTGKASNAYVNKSYLLHIGESGLGEDASIGFSYASDANPENLSDGAVTNASPGDAYKFFYDAGGYYPKYFSNKNIIKFTKGTTYKISAASAQNGSVEITDGKTFAPAGETVQFTVKPNSGFELDTVVVSSVALGDPVDGVYSFTMPTSDVTITATFKVRVVPVTGVTLTDKTLSLAVGATQKLQANITPDDATNKNLQWTTNNQAIAQVDEEGNVTGKAVGTATITVTTEDGGCTDTCTVTVKIPVATVALNQSSITLNKGSEETLTATVTPNNATYNTVTWTTGNEAIATVDANGKVTAVGAGTTTITATADGKSATCAVTVVVPVTGVTLQEETLIVAVSGTSQLTATVNPEDATDKTVTWTSANTAIATVDANGKVTAVAAGTTTITATANGYSDTCKVTVVVPVTSVALQQKTLTVAVGGESQLTATVKPDNATDKTVTWSSTDATVATVENGLVRGIKAGTTTIKATAGDKSDTCVVTVAYGVADKPNDGFDVQLPTDTFPAAGEDVTFTVEPEDSTALTEDKVIVVTVTAGDKTIPVTKNPDGSYTFEMPEGSNISISAEIKYQVNPEEDTAGTAHGSVTVSHIGANPGDEVTITAAPDNGYKVEQVIVVTGSGESGTQVGVTDNNDNTYTFEMPDGAVKIETVWAPITYTITYNLNGGTVATANPTTYTVESETITLKNPTKTGYTFAGWTGEDLSGAQETVTISRGSTGNRKYTATWTINQYTITYDLNSGTVATANPTSYNVESNPITLNNPTKVGYDFAGWTGTDLTVATTEVTIAKGSTGAREYTATWNPITYTITYDLAGGTLANDESNPATYNIESNAITLSNPTKTGYIFAGWTGEDLSGAQETVTISRGSTGNRKYTATWTINQYTITYNLNSGTVATANPTSYNVESEAITLNNPTKVGYDFAGWTGTDLTVATTEVTIAKGSTGAREYTATWNPITYTITYDLAGGTLANDESNPATYNIESNAITLKNPTKVGYNFAGWTGSNGTTANTNVTIAKGSTENRSYVATWTPAVYTVTYNANGGSWADNATTKPVSQTYDASLVLPEGTVTRNGYKFAGWFTAAEDGNQVTDQTKYTTAGVTTYYAHWTAETYAIKYENHFDTLTADAVKTFTVESDAITLPVLNRAGYRFDGWYADAGFSGNAVTGITKGSTGNKTFYAKWTQLYKITMADPNIAMYGGETLNNKEFTEGSQVKFYWRTDVVQVIRTDDTLVELEQSTEATQYIYTFTMPDSNVRIDAWYYVDVYSDNNGTVTLESNSAKAGDKVALTVKAKEGYILTDLYVTENAVGTADETGMQNIIPVLNNATGNYEFTMPAYHAAVIAEFTQRVISNVTLDTNGGTVVKNNVEQYYEGIGATLPTQDDMSRDHYTFSGWYDNAELTGSAVTSITATDSGDKVYYAKWTAIEYPIAYNLDGGSLAEGVTNPSTYTIESPVITLNNPTKTGYTFAGWTGTDLTEATTEVTIAKGSTGEREYTATWTANTYTVTFDGNGATNGSMENQTMTYDTAAALTANGFSRTGYAFAGWNTKTDGSGTAYTAGASVKNLTATAGGTVTLYAQWTANTYQVTFNSNGGTGTMDNQAMTYDTAAALTANGFSRTGYSFAGWNTETDGKGTSYADKASVNNLTANAGETVALYAQWTANTYNAVFDANGGAWKDVGPNKEVPTVFGQTITAPAKPERAGYTFAAWNPQVGTMDTEGKTFTAQWKLDAATITDVAGYSEIYDETEHSITVTASHPVGNITYQWYKGGKTEDNKIDEATSSSYQVTNVADNGSYYCKVTVTVAGESADVWSDVVTVSISKANPVAVAPVANTLTYSSDAQELVTAGTVNGGIMMYSLNGSEWSSEVPEATAAGTYTVSWKVVGDGNHNDYVSTAGIPVTISKADPDVDAPEAKTLTYTGADQALITAGTVNGGIMMYSLNGSEWSAEVPKATAAGTYTVSWKVVGDSNHNNFEPATTVSVTIAKAPLTVKANDHKITYGEAPANNGVTYSGLVNGDNAAKLEAESTLAYTYSYAQYGDVGEYTITPKNLTSGNYEITFVSGKLTVVQKEVEEPTVSKPYTYTGEEQTVELDGFDDAYMQVSGNKGIDATYYDAVVTLGGNYTWADGADGLIEWCIEKAALTDISVAQDGVLYYTGEPQVPQVITEGSTVDGESVNFRYRINYHQSYSPLSILSQKFIEVKDYTVYYKASAENHNDVEGSFTVTVAKAAVPGSSAFSYTEPTLTYNGLEQNISVTTDLDGVAAEDITVIYSATPRNAGDYTFTIKVAESQNYLAGTVTDPAWAFTIAKADPQITWETTEFTYDKQSHGEAAVTLVNGETYTGKITYTFGGGEEGLPVNAGTYSVTASVAEQDNYNAATATKSVTVKPKAVTPTVTLSEESFTWDGTAKKPTVVVKDGDDVLSSGEYSVTYADNTVVGVGNVCVTDKENGNYTVAKTDKKFLILPDVSDLKTPDTVTSAKEDTDAIAAVENEVAKIKNHAQYEDASLAAKADLARVETLCLSLRAAISNAAEKSEQITQSTENLPEQPTTDNLAGIQNALDTYESIKDNLTEAEKEALADEIRELEQQKAAIEKTNADLKSVDDGTDALEANKPNLKYEDKATIKALEDKIADMEKNNAYLSESDKQDLQDQKETLEELKAEFAKADKVTDQLNALNTKAEPDDGNAVKAYEEAKKEYAQLSESDKAKVNPAAPKRLEEMKAALTAYRIIKGDGAKHELGSSHGLTIVSNGYYPHFRYVKVNGREISSSNYTSASGSTIVTLKPEYVNRLMTGKYTITIGFGDEDYIGEATANVQLYTDSGLPFTGDTIAMWIAIMAVSAGALIVVLVFAKKKFSNKK